MSKVDEIVKRFTGHKREWTRSPVLFDESVVATDGLVLIRVPANECESTYEPLKTRIALDAPLRSATSLDEPRTFRVDELEVFDPLILTSLAERERLCPECEGSQYCWCSCGHEHDCPKCEGSGRTEPVPEMYAKLGEGVFNYKYLQLLFRAAEHLNGGVFEMTATGATSISVFAIGANAEIAMMPVAKVPEDDVINLENNRAAQPETKPERAGAN